jgi:hypothetical protein
MDPSAAYYTAPPGNKLFSKKNIILLVFLLVMVIALPVGVYLVQKTQIFKSRAAFGLKTGLIYNKATIAEAGGSETAPVFSSTKKGEIVIELDSTKLTAATIFGVSQPSPSGLPSAAVSPAASAAKFDKPIDLKAECSINNEQVKLSWKKVEGAEAYNYSVGTTSVITTKDNFVPSVFVARGQKYSWNVYVVGKAGGSGQSETAVGEFTCG